MQASAASRSRSQLSQRRARPAVAAPRGPAPHNPSITRAHRPQRLRRRWAKAGGHSLRKPRTRQQRPRRRRAITASGRAQTVSVIRLGGPGSCRWSWGSISGARCGRRVRWRVGVGTMRVRRRRRKGACRCWRWVRILRAGSAWVARWSVGATPAAGHWRPRTASSSTSPRATGSPAACGRAVRWRVGATTRRRRHCRQTRDSYQSRSGRNMRAPSAATVRGRAGRKARSVSRGSTTTSISSRSTTISVSARWVPSVRVVSARPAMCRVGCSSDLMASGRIRRRRESSWRLT